MSLDYTLIPRLWLLKQIWKRNVAPSPHAAGSWYKDVWAQKCVLLWLLQQEASFQTSELHSWNSYSIYYYKLDCHKLDAHPCKHLWWKWWLDGTPVWLVFCVQPVILDAMRRTVLWSDRYCHRPCHLQLATCGEISNWWQVAAYGPIDVLSVRAFQRSIAHTAWPAMRRKERKGNFSHHACLINITAFYLDLLDSTSSARPALLW